MQKWLLSFWSKFIKSLHEAISEGKEFHNLVANNHHGSQPVGTPQSVGIKGQFIPATPQSTSFSVNSEPIPATPQIFTVNSEPISSTSISSVSGSLSNTIDISELIKDSQNTERGFFSNSKMGQIP